LLTQQKEEKHAEEANQFVEELNTGYKQANTYYNLEISRINNNYINQIRNTTIS